jgi:hypothetical protein
MVEHIEGTHFAPRPEVPDDLLQAQVRQRLNNRLDALNKDIATGREQIRKMRLASELYHLRQERKTFDLRRVNVLEDISRGQVHKMLWFFGTFMAIVPYGLMLYEWAVARTRSNRRQHAREWTEAEDEGK